MKQFPTISVIIPTFNRGATISRAIDSALSQTVSPSEIIVVDDGSTDRTMSVVRSYSDSRIKYFQLTMNQGAQNARIRGIHEAQGEFLAFLDSDDEWPEDSLEIRLTSFLTAGFREGLIYGDAEYRGEKSELFNFKKLSGIRYRYLLKELSLCPFSVMLISRSCFLNGELPSGNLPSWQDDDMVLTVSKKFPVHHCGSVVATMHRSPNGISLDKYAIYNGCRQMVDKYAADIIEYHGYFRFYLWKLRVVKSLLAAKLAANRGTENRLSSIVMLQTFILLIGHKTLKAFLGVFFERVDF